MATFPPQHWARVWSQSLRLGGARLPGLSLHWDPNTYNLALTYISLKTTFCEDWNGGRPRPQTELLSLGTSFISCG